MPRTATAERPAETPVATPQRRRGRPPGSKNKAPSNGTHGIVNARVVLLEREGSATIVTVLTDSGTEMKFRSEGNFIMDRRQ